MTKTQLWSRFPYLFACLWMSTLFWFSSRAGGTGWGLPTGVDKVAHFGMYAVLLLTFRPPGALRRDPREWIPFAFGACLVFACTDEFHQAFVPERSPHWGDLLADVAGAGGMAWVLWRMDRRRG